jgi:hypothetical protein
MPEIISWKSVPMVIGKATGSNLVFFN